MPTLDAAFTFGSQLAVLGWLSLILLPRWRGVSALLAGMLIPATLSLGYVVLIAVHWHDAKGGFSSLDDLAALFGSRPLLLAGWLHYLAFDLLLGNWILRRAQEAKLPHPLVVPVLLATFLFGPIGYLAFLLLKGSFWIGRDDRIARAQARLPAWLCSMELNPRLTAAGLAMLALMLPTALAHAVDQRLFQDTNVWLKPLKFEASLVVYFLTLALVLPMTSEAFRASRLGRYVFWGVVPAGFLEVAYIAWRASRAEASHYNASSWLASALYNAMGVGAVMITLGSGALAYGLARRDAAPLAPPLRWSLLLGFALTCILGLASGATLSVNGSHFVGAAPAAQATLPLFGWSLTSGDLRMAHFLGLHALQIIPAFGLLVWLLTRQSRLGTAAISLFAGAYALVTLGAFMAALSTRPLLGLS